MVRVVNALDIIIIIIIILRYRRMSDHYACCLECVSGYDSSYRQTDRQAASQNGAPDLHDSASADHAPLHGP